MFQFVSRTSLIAAYYLLNDDRKGCTKIPLNTLSVNIATNPTGEPNPPFNISIKPGGTNLVAMWSEPFSLEGEELSYVVCITNTASGVRKEVTVNTSTYVLTEPLQERNCEEYRFTVFSKNDYFTSNSSVNGYQSIPTGTIK